MYMQEILNVQQINHKVLLDILEQHQQHELHVESNKLHVYIIYIYLYIYIQHKLKDGSLIRNDLNISSLLTYQSTCIVSVAPPSYCCRGHFQTISTPCACVRGKVIGLVVAVVDTKLPNLAVQALEQVVSTTNMLNLAKNWLQFAQNRVAQPTSVTNSVLQLAIVATPIDYAHYTCKLCMYLLLMCMTVLVHVQVKAIDSICPGYMIMRMQGPRRVGYVLLEIQFKLGSF